MYLHNKAVNYTYVRDGPGARTLGRASKAGLKISWNKSAFRPRQSAVCLYRLVHDKLESFIIIICCFDDDDDDDDDDADDDDVVVVVIVCCCCCCCCYYHYLAAIA